MWSEDHCTQLHTHKQTTCIDLTSYWLPVVGVWVVYKLCRLNKLHTSDIRSPLWAAAIMGSCRYSIWKSYKSIVTDVYYVGGWSSVTKILPPSQERGFSLAGTSLSPVLQLLGRYCLQWLLRSFTGLPGYSWAKSNVSYVVCTGCCQHTRAPVDSSVAPILYWLSVYRLYRPKISVLAIGNITKCILVTKI